MADKDIPSLTTATLPLDGTELIHIVQAGNSRGASVQKIAPVVLTFWASAKPAANEVVFQHLAIRSFRLPASLTGSRATLETATTASATFNLKKNGTTVATITFAAGGSTATLTMASATDFAAGDKLAIQAPSTQDTTLADLTVSLLGGLI